jgi:hypothetical protein
VGGGGPSRSVEVNLIFIDTTSTYFETIGPFQGVTGGGLHGRCWRLP